MDLSFCNVQAKSFKVFAVSWVNEMPRITVMRHILLIFTCCWSMLAALPAAEHPVSAYVEQIRVQPDKAPDCTSLKTIAESVTRDCQTNDAKAIAIYNFMQLAHYHRDYPSEPGGVPVLKEFTNYGWSLCGGLHAEQSALWRQLGWEWQFVGWDGHTTVEAKYDGRWHYLDVFLKFYAWMPDGKGGRTIAGEDDLTANTALITDAFSLNKGKNVVYANNNQFVMNGTKANWRAPSFLSCGDDIAGTVAGLKTHRRAGSPEGWAGINHADGDYTTRVDLAPGFALTNTWDPIADAWHWEGKQIAPGHTCSGHKDTRNDPGIGLVLEPYINAKPCRSYGNGTVNFSPDFSSAALLTGFVSADNAAYKNASLVPADGTKPAMVVFRMASPYIMTKASGSVGGEAKTEVSTDSGKTYSEVDKNDFTAAVKGKLAALVRLTFTNPLTSLTFETVVQNNPGALPYLSPGNNTIAVSVADAQALGNNTLVVTYAYRLGSRTKSFEQLCEQGKEIAKQHNATWSDTVTYVRKTFAAKDLPATFTIDCPTPKGHYPVYPRMLFMRREIRAPGAAVMPLPAGAVEATVGGNDELMSLPNPFLVGTEEPPVITPRQTKTIEIPMHYVQFADAKGTVSPSGLLAWPKNAEETGTVIAGVALIAGDLKDLPAKNIAAARLCVPVIRGHKSAPAQLGVVFLKAPVAKGAVVDIKALPDAEGTGLVPKQPGDTPEYKPAKVIPIDVTRSISALAGQPAAFNGMALRIVPNRSVDDGYTVRCDVSSTDKIVLQIDVYTDTE